MQASNESTDPHRDFLVLRARITNVPEHIIDGLVDYILRGVPVGDFLQAVLSNDLAEACARADDINRYALFQIVTFVWNNCPHQAWGSPQAVKSWLDKHHQHRVQRRAEEASDE